MRKTEYFKSWTKQLKNIYEEVRSSEFAARLSSLLKSNSFIDVFREYSFNSMKSYCKGNFLDRTGTLLGAFAVSLWNTFFTGLQVTTITPKNTQESCKFSHSQKDSNHILNWCLISVLVQ